jgi:hypothetical protein
MLQIFELKPIARGVHDPVHDDRILCNGEQDSINVRLLAGEQHPQGDPKRSRLIRLRATIVAFAERLDRGLNAQLQAHGGLRRVVSPNPRRSAFHVCVRLGGRADVE